jgi:hypothetical protein
VVLANSTRPSVSVDAAGRLIVPDRSTLIGSEEDILLGEAYRRFYPVTRKGRLPSPINQE